MKMPNRIIKESICTSNNIDMLSTEAEVLFYRLMVQCDDYGIFFADVPIVKSKCFPWRADKIKDKDVEKWINELQQSGLIFLYEYDSRCYLKFAKWEEHQQIRAKKSKYPTPDCEGAVLISVDSNGNQLQENVPVIQSNRIRIRNRESYICDTKKQNFIPPTLEEVKEYCKERKNNVDPDKWINHYTANGWMVGKNKMKDWKAAVRTWEKNNIQSQTSIVAQKGNFEQRTYSDEYYDKLYKNGRKEG
jgi:hypothetical protein